MIPAGSGTCPGPRFRHRLRRDVGYRILTACMAGVAGGPCGSSRGGLPTGKQQRYHLIPAIGINISISRDTGHRGHVNDLA